MGCSGSSDSIKDGKIHPTDIDVVLEFNNEALILMEVKRINNKIPIGQRLVLERICNNWRTSKSIALYVTHNFKQDELDIPLQKCFVSGYYYNKKWYDVKEEPLKLVDISANTVVNLLANIAICILATFVFWCGLIR